MEKRSYELFRKAQTALANNQVNMAIKLCKEAAKYDPDARIYALLGESYMVINDYANAEKSFVNSVKQDDKVGEYWFLLGSAKLLQQKIYQAVADYATALEASCSDDVEKKIYYIMGAINQDNGQNTSALANYEKAENIEGLNEDHIDILIKKMQLYLKDNDIKNAKKSARQIILLAPDSFLNYQRLFAVSMQDRDIKTAASVLNEALNRFSKDEASMVEMLFDKAMLSCLNCEIYPNETEKFYEQANSALEEICKTEYASKSDKAEAAITRCDILVKLSRFDEAIDIAKKIENTSDEDLFEIAQRAGCLLIEALYLNNDYLGALEYAKRLKLSDTAVNRNYAYYEEAFITKKLSEKDSSYSDKAKDLYDLAIAYFKNVSVANPQDVTAYMFRTKCYADIKKYDKAYETMKVLPEKMQESLKEYIEKVKNA